MQGSKARPHLEHVVNDVELDDRLTPYQVIHHGVVDVVHHEIADHQQDALQNVAYLSGLQQAPVPATNSNDRVSLTGMIQR